MKDRETAMDEKTVQWVVWWIIILDLSSGYQGLFWVRSEMGMCDSTVGPQGNHKRPTKKGLE